MKGRGKRLATLLTLMMLVLSSVLVVQADSNTTLIQRSTSVSDQNQQLNHTKVSVAADTTDTASFTLTVKRVDDSFDLYNLITITPSNSQGNDKITSLTINWATPVAQFISRHDVFSKDATYMTPETLGAYTVDQTLSEEDRKEAEAEAKAEKEKMLIDLVKEMKKEYEDADDKSTTAIGQLQKVASLSASSVYSDKTLNYEKLGNGTNLNTIGDVVIKGDGVTGTEGTYEWNFTYDISQVPFGLYFVDASNPIRSAAGGYQPVVVDLIPEQTGPSGNWYMDNTKTAILKNEGIGIDKTINDGKYDIVRQGELVDFRVQFDIPLYNKTNGVFDFTKFNAIDDMSQGFTLIATSASLTFFDANGNEFHPKAAMTGDGYGNKIVNDNTGTYQAKLIGYSYPVYYSDDETQKAYFYISEVSSGNITVWTNNNGELASYPMSKNKTNGTYVFSVNELNAINNNLGTDRKIPAAYMTTTNAPKFTLAENTKSLIAINFNYAKLMDEDTYTDATLSQGDQTEAAAFTIPSKIVVDYQTIVNDTFHLGTDDNTNLVKLYYIEDSTGTVGTVESEVVAWTYGANIVKVDGSAYDEYLALSAEEKANATSPYLEGAVFDMYRKDVTYCGGTANANQSAEPAQSAYNTFYFYDDVDYPQADDSVSDLQTRYANAKSSYIMDTFYNAFKYEFTQKRGIIDANTIGAELVPALQNFPNYLTADTFTNKYNFSALYAEGTNMKDIHDNYNGNILLDYISPKVKTDDVNGLSYDKDSDFDEGFVQYVPRWVDSCAANGSGHWHLDAYALYWADTTSVANDTGITLTGLDPNSYLLVEKTPPAGGYNKLNTAIYFEVNTISNDTYAARDNSYAGFLSDEYVDDEGNSVVDDNEDGIYHFVVKNFTGLTLPSTGGMGTLIFTLIGIVVMGTVIAFIVARNKKMKKSAAAYMAIALTIISLFGGSYIKADAATTISLGQTGAGTAAAQKAVPGGTAEFTVHLRDANDKLEAYQIAYSEYDDTKDEWGDLTWVPNLQTYLGNFSLDTDIDNIPTSPEMFADTTQINPSEQTAFLEWVYNTKDKSGIGTTYKVTADKIKTVKNSSTNEYYATIKNVQYGMYLVKGTNETLHRSYSVLTLSATPILQGPMGVYYLIGDLEATLKYADVSVDKKINGKDSDVVREGEVVDFEVVGEIPEYYPISEGIVYTDADGELYTQYDWNANYKFSFEDIVSPAFTINPSSVKIELSDSKADNATWTVADAANYTALIAPVYNTTTKQGVLWYRDSTDNDGNYIVKLINSTTSGTSTTFNLTYYIYNSNDGSIKQFATGTANAEGNATAVPDATVVAAYQTALGKTSVGTVTKVDSRAIFDVAFEYDKLIELGTESGKWELKDKYIRVTYDATVTDKCLPGSEENTNTAMLWYRSDISGHYNTVKDVVNGYTYAVRVVKTDGEDQTKYLKGAKFNLYKEAYIYLPNAAPENYNFDTTPDSSSWAYYTFDSYADNGEYASQEGTPMDGETELTTAAAVEAATFGGLDKYFRYVPKAAGEDGIETAHYEIHVYKQVALDDQQGTDAQGQTVDTVKDNEILSIDTEDGVLIEGLENASYVLIETVSPTGYNALTEAMRFEIQSLTAEQHELDDNVAYTTDAIFYSANKVTKLDVDAVAVEETENGETVTNYYQGYSDGIYGINVKNYQGLTLPSTGGIGTLLFTLIGVVIMALVIVVIILKRRKTQTYM